MTRVRLALALVLLTSCATHHGTTPPLPPIATEACPPTGTPLTGPGQRLPDVTLPCLGQDRSVSLRALGGLPTVLNIWASWCVPCATEMPEFEKARQALAGKVRFLGVDTKDFRRAAHGTIQATGVSYASVFDPDQKVQRALNALRAVPDTVFVGADGVIRTIHLGQLTGAELRASIKKYLGVS